MQVNYLIIGQGISGTFLSWELQKRNQSFLVIDEANPFTASRVASGVINPVTGRRIVKTWMIDQLMPFAWQAYQNIGTLLQADCIASKNIIDLFATPQMRLAFLERFEKDPQYLALPANENDKLDYLNYELGYGIISPCYWINLALLLDRYRSRLQQSNRLLEEHFNINALTVTPNSIAYKNITAEKIIFCDGVAGFNNPYFRNLPYAANKGEAILVEINDLPATQLIKKGYSLVPWKDNVFWLGASYLWEFEDDKPTKGFYRFAENWLRLTLKLPFKIVDHLAAVRPATLERRPFIGIHPEQKAVVIFNGMGTKGCSLTPYFASELADHLLQESPLTPEADVQRFKKLLGRVAP
jgi:glycine/D-amino acid oxidase-like deaminating enzyme